MGISTRPHGAAHTVTDVPVLSKTLSPTQIYRCHLAPHRCGAQVQYLVNGLTHAGFSSLRTLMVFRTIISVKQLSIYGAVSDLCEEHKASQVRTVRPVLSGQSDPLFEPASFVDENTYTFDRSSFTRTRCERTL